MAEDFDRETRHLLNNHIQVTQIKLDNMDRNGATRHEAIKNTLADRDTINSQRHAALAADFARMESTMKWAGGLIISIMLSVLAWAVTQQISANESQKKDIESKIQLLEAQERARLENQARAQLSAPGAAQASGTTSGLGQGINLGDQRLQNRAQN